MLGINIYKLVINIYTEDVRAQKYAPVVPPETVRSSANSTVTFIYMSETASSKCIVGSVCPYDITKNDRSSRHTCPENIVSRPSVRTHRYLIRQGSLQTALILFRNWNWTPRRPWLSSRSNSCAKARLIRKHSWVQVYAIIINKLSYTFWIWLLFFSSVIFRDQTSTAQVSNEIKSPGSCAAPHFLQSNCCLQHPTFPVQHLFLWDLSWSGTLLKR